MAKENGAPTAAEKGKGKMAENKSADSQKPDEIKKDKDGKPIVKGKKGDEPEEGWLSTRAIWWEMTDN